MVNGHRFPLAFLAAGALVLTGACMNAGKSDDEQPPERVFDESTAWDRIEGAAAEAIEGLPDFPGFKVRVLLENECVHDGEADEDYVNYELHYQFSEEVSQQSLVREEYRELLRDKWQEAGYDIHRDIQQGDDPPYYALEARRPDGVNFWYKVAGLTVLTVQSGCVKAVGRDDYACPDPLGGVTRENDRSPCNPVDTEYAEESPESPSGEAVAPLDGPGSETGIKPFDSPRSVDGSR